MNNVLPLNPRLANVLNRFCGVASTALAIWPGLITSISIATQFFCNYIWNQTLSVSCSTMVSSWSLRSNYGLLLQYLQFLPLCNHIHDWFLLFSQNFTPRFILNCHFSQHLFSNINFLFIFSLMHYTKPNYFPNLVYFGPAFLGMVPQRTVF